jgi:hypothetical protein
MVIVVPPAAGGAVGLGRTPLGGGVDGVGRALTAAPPVTTTVPVISEWKEQT